jgi:hypothetical protein
MDAPCQLPVGARRDGRTGGPGDQAESGESEEVPTGHVSRAGAAPRFPTIVERWTHGLLHSGPALMTGF